MTYDYQHERPKLFTEEGQVMFLKIRDRTRSLLKTSGAARADKMTAGVTGLSWTMQACLDRMVELEEIREVSPPGTWGQYRIFTVFDVRDV